MNPTPAPVPAPTTTTQVTLDWSAFVGPAVVAALVTALVAIWLHFLTVRRENRYRFTADKRAAYVALLAAELDHRAAAYAMHPLAEQMERLHEAFDRERPGRSSSGDRFGRSIPTACRTARPMTTPPNTRLGSPKPSRRAHVSPPWLRQVKDHCRTTYPRIAIKTSGSGSCPSWNSLRGARRRLSNRPRRRSPPSGSLLRRRCCA